MNYHALPPSDVFNKLNSDVSGLNENSVKVSREKFGLNRLTTKKKKNVFQKITSTLKEPMLIILLFSFILSFGANVGQLLRTGDADFKECFGILFAVVLSVGITLFMEGSSEKAFRALGKIYDNVYVKVVRGGKIVVISQENVVVADLLKVPTYPSTNRRSRVKASRQKNPH